MSPALNGKFERLQCQKLAVLSQMKGLTPEQLNLRPEPSGWSVLEVLDHVTKVESALLDNVRINLAQSASVTLKERAGAWLVVAVMLSPIRIKVPASATAVLPELTSLAAIASNWDQIRSSMHQLLTSLQPEDFRRGLFRHPVCGWMTIAGALTFLSAHLHHHRYQINRLKAGSRAH